MSKNLTIEDESFDNNIKELKTKFKSMKSTIDNKSTSIQNMESNDLENNNNKKYRNEQKDNNNNSNKRSSSSESGSKEFLSNYRTTNSKRGRGRFNKNRSNRNEVKTNQSNNNSINAETNILKEDKDLERIKKDKIVEEVDVFSLMTGNKNDQKKKRTIVSEKTKRNESGIVAKLPNGQLRSVGGFYTWKDRQVSELKFDFMQGENKLKGSGRVLNKCTSIYVTNRCTHVVWIKNDNLLINELYFNTDGDVEYKNVHQYYIEDGVVCDKVTSIFDNKEELFIWDDQRQLIVVNSPVPPLFIQLKLVSNEVVLLQNKEISNGFYECKIICDKKELLTNSGLKQPFTYDLIQDDSMTEFTYKDLDTPREEEMLTSLKDMRPIFYCSTDALLRLNSRLEKDFK